MTTKTTLPNGSETQSLASRAQRPGDGMGEGKTALVIGAGFGGLATAIRLLGLGYSVRILERLENAGGRAQVFERDGYRHDAGPTVITAHFIFDELFEILGENRADHIEFLELKEWYEFYFADGSRFKYGPTPEATEAAIREISPDDVEGYRKMVAHSKRIYEVGWDKLVHVPFRTIWDMLKLAPTLIGLESWRTVSGFVSKYLKHPKLRMAFSIQPLLVGGNPFSTSSVYSLIHYLEVKSGVFFTKGGTGAVVKGMRELIERHNGIFTPNATVKKIETRGDRVTAAITEDGTRYEADLIAFNGDPPHLYNELLDDRSMAQAMYIPPKLLKWSMGLYVLYFGTDRKYEDVAHHTIWLTERYKELLADIFAEKELPDDFSLYVHRPTATDPDFAPEGHESFYVLCPVPNLRADIDWTVMGDELRDRIVEALDDTMLPDLKKHIRSDFYMTPEDFKERYLTEYGTGFSIAPLFRQSASMRFKNQDDRLKNLFVVGAGAHPGAGLPGVISSAKVVETILREEAEAAEKNTSGGRAA